MEESEGEIGAFLTVFAALLLDNVVRLDETVGTVTDYVMATKPSRDLVVTLQSFDRLKQEFEALGEALTRYAEAHSSAPLSAGEHAQLAQNVIGGITVHDLKERLMDRWQDDLPELPLPVITPEEAAQIDIDVVY